MIEKHILDQIELANIGKNTTNKNVVNEEDFDPNPFLKSNYEKVDEHLSKILNHNEDYAKRLTEMIYSYLINPIKYEKEEESIEFIKELDFNRIYVFTLNSDDINNLEKKVNLIENLELQNKNLYRKIINLLEEFKQINENNSTNSNF